MLEQIALVHVVVLVLLASWGFGGNAPWSRVAVTWWATLGGLILLAAFGNSQLRNHRGLRPLRWLWPLGLLNVLVLASTLNPSFREITSESDVLLVKIASVSSLPSSARPGVSLQALWLFDAIYISCFNLALVIQRRRALRALLLIAAANALVLAVFGTVQKWLASPGLYFGAVPSPQKFFFATFVYHNHWGAFAVLMTAIVLGLVTYYARRGDERGFWHSPAFSGVIALFFLAVSIPLSTSRSCTLLVLALLAWAALQWLRAIIARRRALKASILSPVLGASLTIVAAVGAVYLLARPVIDARFAKTREQLTEMRARGSVGSRATLYGDTWRMAMDKPVFGWGMGSYRNVFLLYNTQESRVDRLPIYYQDAHSDWLQSVAELGFVGTILLGLHALVPLWSLRRRGLGGSLPTYLFVGCALVLLYAWVEFPFGNPAVVIAWWLCFFTALRYARLETQPENA